MQRLWALVVPVTLAAVGCSNSDDSAGRLDEAFQRIEQLESDVASLDAGLGRGTDVPSATDSTPATSTAAPTSTVAAPATGAPSTTRRTTTTVRRTTTTAPAIGTRSNPIPAGLVAISVGDWEMLVVGFESGIDARRFNQFNDAAPPGSQYVRVRVRLTYTGDGTGSPMLVAYAGLNLVGESGRTYKPASVSPGSGADPERLDDQPETFNGGSVEGWIYYVVEDVDVLGQLLLFPTDVNYTDIPGGVAFFEVR